MPSFGKGAVPIVVPFLLAAALLACRGGEAEPGEESGDPAAEGGPRRPCGPPRGTSPSWFELEPVFGKRRFRKPVQALPHPTRPGVWWVVESEGRVVEVAEKGDAATLPRVVLDVRDRVRAGHQWGLQQIALSPRFPEDPRVFVTYTATPRDPKLSLDSRVAEFRSTDGGRTFDASSERILLGEPQRHVWHPIAGLAFGPDGMLYVGWGEGGGLTSEWAKQSLRGKILRIDVDTDDPRGYVVPPDNPFLDGSYPPESWAVGFRNPWRFSFDSQTGDLWVGDVGGRAYEEVGLVRRGEHHGWPLREGFDCRLPEECDTPTTPPRAVHSSLSVCAVIGGHVYRGSSLPWLRGKYVYADYCSRALYAFDPKNDRTELLQRLDTDLIAALEVDREGELYVVEAQGRPGDPETIEEAHRILRLRPTGEPREESGPPRSTLAELGCTGDGGPHTPPSGTVRYEVNAAAWDEGARAERAVQPGFRPVEKDDESLPRRPKVYLKTLFVDDRAIETQMLAVDGAGDWGAWSFAWDDDQKAARLVTSPTSRRLPDGTEWQFDTAPACLRCHSEAAGRILGFTVPQLDRDGQLEDWFERGVLETSGEPGAILGALRQRPRLVDPADATADRNDRARSLLHARCSPCHRPGGESGSSSMDFTRLTPLPATNACGARPTAEYPELGDVRLLDPGHPERSLVYLRMVDTGSLAMPPGRRRVDETGAELIREWIESLDPGCGSTPQ